MSKKIKAVATEPKALTRTREKKRAQAALMPSFNAAVVMTAYQDNIVGKDVDLVELVESLRESFDKSKDGDLSGLEQMLIGQATALQSIFTSLARRAQVQEYQKNLESFLSLALKAQAQSRATIQAVVELKYPRQVAFVKQANISHGPQQVNNGIASDSGLASSHAHTEKNQSQQNKLLEDQSHERTHLDTGATTAASRSDKTLETVGAVNGAKKRRR
jgi:hypothetical protein